MIHNQKGQLVAYSKGGNKDYYNVIDYKGIITFFLATGNLGM